MITGSKILSAGIRTGAPPLKIKSGVSGNFETETRELLRRMTPPPIYDRAVLINICIKGLKDYSIWDKIDVLRLDASHSEQSSLLNWKGDYWNATLDNSPIFVTDRGWKGSSGNYMKSNFNPSLGGCNYVQDSAMLMIYMNVIPTYAISNLIYNTLSTAGAAWVTINVNGYVSGQVNSSVTNTRSSGVLAGVGFNWGRRLNSTGMTHGKNLSGGTPVYVSVPLFNSSFRELNSDYRQAMVCYSSALATATDLTNFQNTLLTYLTAIGAN